MDYILLLGVILIFLAVLIGLDQFISIGTFIQLRDVLHHEFFMALFGAFWYGTCLQLNRKVFFQSLIIDEK